MDRAWVIALLLIPTAAFGYDIAADYEETAKKLYAEHTACVAQYWDEQFEVETQRCLNNNPDMSQFDCEGDADARLNDIPYARAEESCGELRPTTYTEPSDQRGTQWVASTGAMKAMNDGQLAKGVTMFKECVAVGDVDCHYRLGVLTYQGRGVEQNHTEAIKLLRFAADNGHDEAQSFLNKIDTD